MKTTTSAHVFLKLKATCTRYGIPDVVVSDNGPQFTSAEFQDLALDFDFKHLKPIQRTRQWSCGEDGADRKANTETEGPSRRAHVLQVNSMQHNWSQPN